MADFADKDPVSWDMAEIEARHYAVVCSHLEHPTARFAESIVHRGRRVECFAESDHSVWISGHNVELHDTVEFRGWECSVFSMMMYARPSSTQLLLRRERRTS